MLARDCYALQWFEDKLGCHLAVGEDGQQVTMDWSDITNKFKKRIKGSRKSRLFTILYKGKESLAENLNTQCSCSVLLAATDLMLILIE